MLQHAAACGVGATLVLLATLLPFFPGSYDPVAAPLSSTARIAGGIGLLLVPFGALWLARPGRGTAIAALAGFSLMWGLTSLAAFMTSGYSLAGILLLLGVYLFGRLRTAVRGPTRAAGLYLVALPTAIVVLQQALLGPAIAFSRDRAIRNAAPLIADIERHRAERRAYPPSLLSVWPDYKPGVIGIERYRYEPSGESYNLVFEQLARTLATREFVVYNPRDEHEFTSHAMDLLEFSPDRLQRARGYFAKRDTAHPHWKYFWFD